MRFRGQGGLEGIAVERFKSVAKIGSANFLINF